MLGQLLKGANKSRLSFANLLTVIKTFIIGAVVLLIAFNATWIYVKTSLTQRRLTLDYWISTLSKHHPSPIPAVLHTLSVLKSGWQWGWITTCVLIFLWIIGLIYKGRQTASRKRLKGAERAPVKLVNRRLKRAGQRSSLRIGNGFYVKNTETEHLLCIGGSGNGKTTFFLHGMENTKKAGHKHVIFDLDGEFTRYFYRPDKDIILSLRDQRSPLWNFFCECDSVFDVEKRAQSMVPVGKKSGEQWLWNYLAQIIFSAVASQLFEKGKTQTADILRYLYAVDREEIEDLLKGTLAEAYVAKGMEKMTGSIKGVLSVYINSLRYVRDQSDNLQDFFSITQWMKDDTKPDSRLFINVQEDDFELFRPVIAFWLDTAVAAALSLEKSHRRRIWFRYDEVATLGHLPSLIAGLTKGRKKGLCFVLGAQSLSQFRDNYSPAQTDIIFDNCHTKLYFAIEGADTAKWAAADIGEEEFQEAQDGMSVSGHHKGGNNLSTSEHTRTMNVVSYTEIKRLPKLTAFLTLPGNWPITQVRFKSFDKTAIHPNVALINSKPINFINGEQGSENLEFLLDCCVSKQIGKATNSISGSPLRITLTNQQGKKRERV